MDAVVTHVRIPGTGEAAPDAFGGVPEAPRGRRVAARAGDVMAALGSPWAVALLCATFMLPFIELIPVGAALFALSCAGALTTWLCSRLPNGDRLSAGSLAFGLTVLRTLDASRVVLAKDVEGPHRPAPRRVLGGRIGLAMTAVVVVAVLGSWGWAAYTAAFQSSVQAAAEARWQAEEPQARKVCDAFTAELLAGGTGEGYAVDEAAEALPAYREHLATTGVKRLESSGWGQSAGDWEYMFTEVGRLASDPADPAQVSVLIQKHDGRFVVTQLSWNAPTAGVSP